VRSIQGVRVTVPKPFQYPRHPDAAWSLAENSIKMLYSSSLKERASAVLKLAKTTLMSRL